MCSIISFLYQCYVGFNQAWISLKSNFYLVGSWRHMSKGHANTREWKEQRSGSCSHQHSEKQSGINASDCPAPTLPHTPHLVLLGTSAMPLWTLLTAPSTFTWSLNAPSCYFSFLGNTESRSGPKPLASADHFWVTSFHGGTVQNCTVNRQLLA